MNESTPRVFTQSLIVSAADMDALQHVNNVVYLQWVQDIAEAHWNHVATMEMKQQCAWVVVKHEIEYFLPAFKGDELHVRTWVEWSEGVRSLRKVEFYNTQQKLVVRAATLWCLLDAQTMKPRKIDTSVAQAFTLP
jgi:acyl-CoA thioester hydrolase